MLSILFWKELNAFNNWKLNALLVLVLILVSVFLTLLINLVCIAFRINSLKKDLMLTNKNFESDKYIPKCPTCGSPNIERIDNSKKLIGAILFGLFSSNVRNTMHCNNCGYKW